ncbi:hypothetical protein [Dokdonella sp.]|uniref:leucine-rich repeat domain-containing protein n=1 Tax=Dokdonella sp. TaxID=2291710 RepID=UPI001B1BA404|nr:hypothetical protein [Dokdonella sp.]MBO9661696.1 hypothetical protein [Dokdonella sp.]
MSAFECFDQKKLAEWLRSAYAVLRRGAHSLAWVAMLFVSFTVPLAEAAIPTTERQALVDLYNATSGPSWTNNTLWLGEVGSECSWFGITCNDDASHVKAIRLVNNRLNGHLADISAFTSVESITITYNPQLGGTLPDLSALGSIKQLFLGANGFIGSIPDLSALTSVEWIVLSGNSLTGNFPDLSALTSLDRFEAQLNYISGPVPTVAQLPSSLKFLYLAGNRLTGGPGGLDDPEYDYSTLPQLIDYDLSTNWIEGSLPPGAYLKHMRYFSAAGNYFTGSIPDPFAGNETVWYDVALNQLDGVIPEFGNKYPNLLLFNASHNELTGRIPSLADLLELQFLALGHNRLTGSLPDHSNNRKLETLWLESNQLTGSLPSFADLTSLYYLQLGGNQFSGDPPDIPDSLIGFGTSYTSICPNNLNHVPNPRWDAATGVSPWYARCVESDFIFRDGFEMEVN